MTWTFFLYSTESSRAKLQRDLGAWLRWVLAFELDCLTLVLVHLTTKSPDPCSRWDKVQNEIQSSLEQRECTCKNRFSTTLKAPALYNKIFPQQAVSGTKGMHTDHLQSLQTPVSDGVKCSQVALPPCWWKWTFSKPEGTLSRLSAPQNEIQGGC